MTVYVDALVIRPSKRAWRWGLSCHLFADSPEDLEAFARKIKLQRGWFQDHDKLPHYDLTSRRREVAVANGAVEVDRRFMYERMKS